MNYESIFFFLVVGLMDAVDKVDKFAFSQSDWLAPQLTGTLAWLMRPVKQTDKFVGLSWHLEAPPKTQK